MENKESNDCYDMPIARPRTGKVQERMARLPPKRGNVKREIFASMAESILHALKKSGTTCLKIVRYAMAVFSCKIGCPEKANSIHCAVDRWESCGHELEAKNGSESVQGFTVKGGHDPVMLTANKVVVTVP